MARSVVMVVSNATEGQRYLLDGPPNLHGSMAMAMSLAFAALDQVE
jgi:hypothetical protein